MNLVERITFEEYIDEYSVYKLKLKGIRADSIEENEKKKIKDGFNKVKQRFRDENGEILNQYICDTSRTAALLCEKRGSWWSSPRTSFFTQYELGKEPKIEELLIDVDFLAAESARTLQGRTKTKCLSLIYKVTKNILELLDSINKRGSENSNTAKVKEAEKISDETIDETISVIESHLEQVKNYHKVSKKFSAQKGYFSGNIIGFLG
ncbi:MAG: hypothetical protein AAFO07_33910, partial [Bacteroidota bacterium]